VNQPDRFQMRLNFVLYRGREPAIRLLSIQKANLSVACFPPSSRTPKLTACGQQLLYIASRQYLCFEKDLLLSGSGNPDLPCACIDTQGDRLSVTTAAIKQLDRKGNHVCHFRLAPLQE
jgi:hypothetical protein